MYLTTTIEISDTRTWYTKTVGLQTWCYELKIKHFYEDICHILYNLVDNEGNFFTKLHVDSHAMYR